MKVTAFFKMIPAKRMFTLCLFIGAGMLAMHADEAAVPVRERPVLEWSQLPSPPAGSNKGSYMSVADGSLVIAGGGSGAGRRFAFFENKNWDDVVYIFNQGENAWREAGRLPRAGGYGLSLPWENGFLLLGGRDASECFDQVWFVSRGGGGALKFESLPKMPKSLAGFSGAIVKGVVYITGGVSAVEGSAVNNTLYCLDLNNAGAGWRELPQCPGGGRFSASAGALGQVFYVFGGTRIKSDSGASGEIEYLSDAWSYHSELGWKQLASLPVPLASACASAVPVGQSHLLLPGGRSDTGVSGSILAYHSITNTWVEIASPPFAIDVGALSRWGDDFVVINSAHEPGATAHLVWRASVIETKASFGWLNYVTLVGYLLGMVGIGWYCARRNKSTDDYFKAGGRIPWWAAGIAIYATMLSSLTFMAIPAKAYATDWTYIWTNVPIFLIAPILIAVYLPFFRRLNVTSAYEYLEKRFNLPVRIYGSAAFILFQVGRQAIVLLLPSIALATVSDFDVSTCIILMGVLCVIYTVMGGMEAVIWTDVAQTFLLIGSALVSFALIAFGTEGGLAGFWSTATANNKFHMFNMTWSPTVAANAFWVIFIGNIFAQLVPYTSDQSIVQRYMTTDSEKKAARSIWFNAVLAIPSSILFFLIGTALFVFYKAHPEKLDPSQATDSIFPAFIVQNLPAGIAGLVIAGIFAAAQSTVSGSLNSVVTALMTDFYGRFGGKAKGAAELRIARILTTLLGAFATVCALVLAKLNLASLWDAYSGLVGLAASGLAGLFALGIFTKRASGVAALIGAVASIAVLYYVQRHTEVHFFLYAGVGMLTCFVVGLLASIAFPSKKNVSGLTFGTLQK